jgi:hypothetical protein
MDTELGAIMRLYERTDEWPPAAQAAEYPAVIVAPAQLRAKLPSTLLMCIAARITRLSALPHPNTRFRRPKPQPSIQYTVNHACADRYRPGRDRDNSTRSRNPDRYKRSFQAGQARCNSPRTCCALWRAHCQDRSQFVQPVLSGCPDRSRYSVSRPESPLACRCSSSRRAT